ncbi:preprotein translocase subunit YajC [Nocardioides alcanivorans]|uniref:preprotein translocase subunit YajC n=1 Tax=Nocardioides alcanivorans TaxID=2897352 RepID=UPI001F347B33|nr:preprotein translocase subunit YajC [Nocardioides alcanivorans]
MGELVSLLPIVAIFAIFYLLMIRPAQRRQKAMREMQGGLSVGDEVLLQSGLFGTIRRFEDNLVFLEIAPGVEVTAIRPAIAGLAKDARPRPVEEATETESFDPDGDR